MFPENWKTEVEIFMLKLIEASFGLKAKLCVTAVTQFLCNQKSENRHKLRATDQRMDGYGHL